MWENRRGSILFHLLVPGARTLLGASAEEAADELGNGSLVTAQNTVPFTMWVAATYLDDYPAAVITCIAGAVEIDATSAIVGGILAAHTGNRTGPIVGIPQTCRGAREALP